MPSATALLPAALPPPVLPPLGSVRLEAFRLDVLTLVLPPPRVTVTLDSLLLDSLALGAPPDRICAAAGVAANALATTAPRHVLASAPVLDLTATLLADMAA
ncbi:MAG: hypothetical protein JNK11_01630 [Alphaproteobacteria bacterium]|nr:hypothetical protein [Alphaproteobacteria bacterium]